MNTRHLPPGTAGTAGTNWTAVGLVSWLLTAAATLCWLLLGTLIALATVGRRPDHSLGWAAAFVLLPLAWTAGAAALVWFGSALTDPRPSPGFRRALTGCGALAGCLLGALVPTVGRSPLDALLTLLTG
ncbi:MULTISPECIES: hypothetical protein [unclassified Kitasatospora]|uniref:hypothetical protein n=1 Tax=unclassified Kitasatospora TaxID=2633591 RepID=UPI001AE06EC5|nr:hypothetical protein [Kitasatospora sp. RG8]MBP0450994.1 hypothetical protein [Kitasatospora sp. RG8]